MKRCNFRQIQTGSNVIRNVKWLCSDRILECLFLSFSSSAWFLEFASQLKGPAQLRLLRCNGPWFCNKNSYLWLTWPHSSSLIPSFFLPLLLFLFPLQPLFILWLQRRWLSLFQRSFFGSLINCLLSVCGVRCTVCFTHSHPLQAFSPPLSGVPSAEALIRLLSWDGRWGAQDWGCKGKTVTNL